jgi:hypothetical protein
VSRASRPHRALDDTHPELPPAPPPQGGPEREKILRDVARNLAAQLGPTTAVYLAALLNEAAEELAGSGADVRAAQLQEGDAP